MVKTALGKINGTAFQKTLEYKKNERKRLEEAKHYSEADKTKASIAGYCQALRDCNIINDRERGALFIYYGTV